MSVKVPIPKGAVAWGVWKGLVHFPDRVFTDQEIKQMAINQARERCEARQRAKQAQQPKR